MFTGGAGESAAVGQDTADDVGDEAGRVVEDGGAGAEFTDPSPAPEAARWFARHALPVDPLRART
ncbi:hypothetical protein ABT116_47785, partial [Streptomyces sp. NPDC002130]|uniref:hypothetical protein n=1 Tax=Streptomyces sp. NPDC002130 TaxID=3155568 RepID=UPI003325C7CF